MEIIWKQKALNNTLLVILIFAGFNSMNAQSFWFGPSGGIGIGTQQWESYRRGPLLTYHLGAFLESYTEEPGGGAIYGSLGIHQRGSSTTNIRVFNGNRTNTKFIFNNLSLELGFKTGFKNKAPNFYFGFGLRGEYTLDTNLDENQEIPNLYFPLDQYVRKFTAGASILAGYTYSLTDLVGSFIQISFQPDFFNQYFSPELGNIINPYNPSNTINIRAQQIKNLSFEVTVGFKFLRKVEYY